MRTVMSLLSRAVEEHADHPYLAGKTADGWKEISFEETDRISDAAAAWFLSERFSRGDRIVLLAEGRPEWVLAELGMTEREDG